MTGETGGSAWLAGLGAYLAMLQTVWCTEENSTGGCISAPNMEEKILSILRKDPRLAYREVHCQAESGRLILRGRVRSYFEKQIAQELLRRVEGVGEIRNELEVSPEPTVPLTWQPALEPEETPPNLA